MDAVVGAGEAIGSEAGSDVGMWSGTLGICGGIGSPETTLASWDGVG